MASTALAPTQPATGKIVVALYDGSRAPVAPAFNSLLRILDGDRQTVLTKDIAGGVFAVQDILPFGNARDNYAVLASAPGYSQAGFFPVKVKAGVAQTVPLMLVKTDASYAFDKWKSLPDSVAKLLVDKDRYDKLREGSKDDLACFLNLSTSMAQCNLPSGTALDAIRQVIWKDLQQDRLFAWADASMVGQVKEGVEHGAFAPELNPGVFHPGATRSYKEIRFGEANLQFTFHESETRRVGGADCVKLEVDIDYYKDPAAHALLEVLPNKLTGGLTDPKQVYVLRWIAGKRAGLPEFAPPYVLV